MRALKKLEFACVIACTGITASGLIRYINAVIVIIPPPKTIEAESADAKKLIKQSIINSINEISIGINVSPKSSDINQTPVIIYICNRGNYT